MMRHLSLCTREQPLVPSSCGFIFSRTNLTTRIAIELATRASFLTITHCTVSKVFLFYQHLTWDKGKTQIGKVKKERKTPDRCYINPGKRNYSISLLSHLRDSQILQYYLLFRGVTDDKVKAFWRGSQTVRAHPQTLLKIQHHVLSVFHWFLSLYLWISSWKRLGSGMLWSILGSWIHEISWGILFLVMRRYFG